MNDALLKQRNNNNVEPTKILLNDQELLINDSFNISQLNYENYKKNDNIRLSDDKQQQTTPLNDDPSLEESLKSKKAPNDLASSDQSIENLLLVSSCCLSSLFYEHMQS